MNGGGRERQKADSIWAEGNPKMRTANNLEHMFKFQEVGGGAQWGRRHEKANVCRGSGVTQRGREFDITW